MAWRIVKQPNGKLARFSDIVDNFTHYDMTEEEAINVCINEFDMGKNAAFSKVQAGIKDFIPWTETPSKSQIERWNDCITTIKNIHGEEEYQEITSKILGEIKENN